MKLETAKNEIDQQFIKAIYSKSDLNIFHSTRVIQALKSLLGIDINHPSEKLIDWGWDYLDDQNIFPKNHFRYSVVKPKETIVLSNLGDQILLKNKDIAILELQDLCSVSDGGQIFEYLLEFSAEHYTSAIVFIWSACRINEFLNNKYSYQLLTLCVNSLMTKNFPINQKYS